MSQGGYSAIAGSRMAAFGGISLAGGVCWFWQN
jgi:hypothetical protein